MAISCRLGGCLMAVRWLLGDVWHPRRPSGGIGRPKCTKKLRPEGRSVRFTNNYRSNRVAGGDGRLCGLWKLWELWRPAGFDARQPSTSTDIVNPSPAAASLVSTLRQSSLRPSRQPTTSSVGIRLPAYAPHRDPHTSRSSSERSAVSEDSSSPCNSSAPLISSS